MRRWDGLLDRYMAECVTRGLAEATVAGRRRELERFGVWLKRQRPKVVLRDVDVELVTRYIKSRKTFRAKASVVGSMSSLRCMGEFLVREGEWESSPLRWMRGPKIDPRSRLPRRVFRGTPAFRADSNGSRTQGIRAHEWGNFPFPV
jgi:site-specific recombinase XerD